MCRHHVLSETGKRQTSSTLTVSVRDESSTECQFEISNGFKWHYADITHHLKSCVYFDHTHLGLAGSMPSSPRMTMMWISVSCPRLRQSVLSSLVAAEALWCRVCVSVCVICCTTGNMVKRQLECPSKKAGFGL